MLLDLAIDPKAEEQLLALNRQCTCLPVDPNSLGLALPDPSRFFASAAVMLSDAARAEMLAQIAAIEAAAALPAFQALTLARAGLPAIPPQSRTRGLVLGYDFHITPDGPRLIEVNTNAGGAFLAANLGAGDCARRKVELSAMFLKEWQAAGREGRPRTIVILDEDPETQFLYPDMCAARDLLAASGITALVAAPADLRSDGAGLWIGSTPVDMIYNRLTDFLLEDLALQHLRAAYEADRVVLSPAPQHYARFADKRNLVLLSDPDFVAGLGLPPVHADALARLPRSRAVAPELADTLWQTRRDLFFKPATGFGSRGAYRGDKLTRRVWDEILTADYIAQDLVPPPLRRVMGPAGEVQLKWDLRIYTYAGSPILMAARLYQGQTTNFRTPGGGFAPVVLGDCARAA